MLVDFSSVEDARGSTFHIRSRACHIPHLVHNPRPCFNLSIQNRLPRPQVCPSYTWEINAQMMAPWRPWLQQRPKRHATVDHEFQLPPKKELPRPTPFSHPKTPFPFMILPDEMKLRIVAYVKVDSPHTFLALRLVHPWFNATISEAERSEILLIIERKASGLTRLFANTLTCFTCLKALPMAAFAEASRTTPMDLGGSEAHRRCCVDCRLKQESTIRHMERLL